jgi:hypothetical protein
VRLIDAGVRHLLGTLTDDARLAEVCDEVFNVGSLYVGQRPISEPLQHRRIRQSMVRASESFFATACRSL